MNQQSVQRTSWTLLAIVDILIAGWMFWSILIYGPTLHRQFAALYGPQFSFDLILDQFCPCHLGLRKIPYLPKNIVLIKFSCYPCPKIVAYAPIEIHLLQGTLLSTTGTILWPWGNLHRRSRRIWMEWSLAVRSLLNKSFVSRLQDFQYLTRWNVASLFLLCQNCSTRIWLLSISTFPVLRCWAIRATEKSHLKNLQ